MCSTGVYQYTRDVPRSKIILFTLGVHSYDPLIPQPMPKVLGSLLDASYTPSTPDEQALFDIIQARPVHLLSPLPLLVLAEETLCLVFALIVVVCPRQSSGSLVTSLVPHLVIYRSFSLASRSSSALHKPSIGWASAPISKSSRCTKGTFDMPS